ncbi:15052_t:CDS:2, partial [Dentiscutata heterogama]
DVGNTTPAPPIEEVEHVLSMRSSVRRINQNSEQNISVPLPPIETLSPQPPPYSWATNKAQNNNQSQDSSNYEVAVP